MTRKIKIINVSKILANVSRGRNPEKQISKQLEDKKNNFPACPKRFFLKAPEKNSTHTAVVTCISLFIPHSESVNTAC